MFDEVKAKLKDVSDDDLFELLDCVSEEVKRRNGLLGGPTIPDIRGQSPEANLRMVIEALAGLGVQVQAKEQAKGDVIDAPADPVKP